MQELYEYIGKITFTMVHVDFVLSFYAAKIKFTPKSDYHYFADTKTTKKLEKLIEFIDNKKNEIKNRNKVSTVLNELKELINERNRFIHALILSSSDSKEYRSYRFILKENIMIRDFRGFEISEIKELEKKFGAIYSDISSFLEN